MGFNYIELSRDDGYESSALPESGIAHCTYWLKQPAVTDLPAFSAFLCGFVGNLLPQLSMPPSGGGIVRALPLTHPFDPSLTIAGITKIVGQGQGTPTDSTEIGDLIPVTPQFMHYTDYWYTAEFKKQPYFITNNASVIPYTTTYYDPAGDLHNIWVAPEWERYCTFSVAPAPDTVNATTGSQMKFRVPGGAPGAPGNNTQFPGKTFVYLQNQVLEVTWHKVPYRYFFSAPSLDPYLTRFINTVNQNELFGYGPGELLFLGATPTVYMPLVQDFSAIYNSGYNGFLVQECTVKLRWLLTTRVGAESISPGTNGTANQNNVPFGHNLLPSFTDRKFHYVTTEDPSNPTDTTKWNAFFQSFAHELFFTDPMLAQPGGNP